MKYLGVILDSFWNFREHFGYVGTKALKVTRALSRFMPNLRGPGERKRHLYASVITSVMMYAAPFFGEGRYLLRLIKFLGLCAEFSEWWQFV